MAWEDFHYIFRHFIQVSITYDRNPETIGAGVSAVIAAAIGLGVFVLLRKMGAAVGGMNPFKTMSKADFTLIDPKTKVK